MAATDTPASPTSPTYVGPAAVATAAAGSMFAVALVDPNVPGSWPVCPSLSLFGVLCPLCGGLRSAHALTDLDLVTAVSSNVVVPLLVVAAGLGWLRWVRRLRRGGQRPTPVPLRVWGWSGAALLLFGLLRNLPAFSLLAP